MAFELKGLDHFFKKLEKIPGAVERAAVSGVNKTQQDITTDAKVNCPVGDTGQLRDSIEPYSNAHKAKEQDGIVSAAVGTNVEHGPYVELGTGPVGASTPASGKYPGSLAYTQKGWTYYSEKLGQFIHTNGQPAQPFLYPAAQAHAGELSENIKKAAEAELKKVTG